MEIVELQTLHIFRCDMNWEHHRHLAFAIEILHSIPRVGLNLCGWGQTLGIRVRLKIYMN